jgi:hypothetical protein
MAPIFHILNRWAWPELFSLSLSRAILVKTNEWDKVFFWPIAVCHLFCNTLRRMKLNRGGQPEARAQVEGPQVKYICKKDYKSLFSINIWTRASCRKGWGVGTVHIPYTQLIRVQMLNDISVYSPPWLFFRGIEVLVLLFHKTQKETLKLRINAKEIIAPEYNWVRMAKHGYYTKYKFVKSNL